MNDIEKIHELKKQRAEITKQINELIHKNMIIGDFKILKKPFPATWSEDWYHVKIKKLSDHVGTENGRYITIIETNNVDGILEKLTDIKESIDTVIKYFENLPAKS